MVVAGVAGEIPVACHWCSRHCTGRTSRDQAFPQKGRIPLSSFPAFDAYLPPLLFQA